MAKRPARALSALKKTPHAVDLGDNPVNSYRALEYARESSPSILQVLMELIENGRDNGNGVVLTIDVADSRKESADFLLTPRTIRCADNGVGLSHSEFLNRFCGAFQNSDIHEEVDRAGRNGVGTKTYTSIADVVYVETTTAKPTEGLDAHREEIQALVGPDLKLPRDGDADSVWRAYEYRLHTRKALPSKWTPASDHEMGTRVQLSEFARGVVIPFHTLIERLSYSRGWLRNNTNSLTVKLTGAVPDGVKKEIVVRPWRFPDQDWLTRATGRSDETVQVHDPNVKEAIDIPPLEGFDGVIEFDFRVVNRDSLGRMKLDKPALLLEVCGGLPYPPELGATLSARTTPLLIFLGLEHVSSIGSFCTAVSGFALINSLEMKKQLRNNKTSLTLGPGNDSAVLVRAYLQRILSTLHRIWYNATRAGSEEITRDALREATEQVNFALKGANTTVITKGPIAKNPSRPTTTVREPVRQHRWECASCGTRWLVDADFVPKMCAEISSSSGSGTGCGSTNIGLARNQPRIGDCKIKLEPLGDRRLPASFQYEELSKDVEVPVIRVNALSPRFVELRGTGSMSGQAQKRLTQYLVDVALVAIGDFRARNEGREFSEVLGDLYYNRMIRSVGIKRYERDVKQIMDGIRGDAEVLLAS